MTQQKITNDIAIETPEGIELKFAIAGPMPRFYAAIIDNVLLAIAIMVVIPLLAFDAIRTGVTLILAFIVYWFVPAIFEWRIGATPGKRVMGLTVINDDGTPLGFHAAFTRNLVRFVDALPFPWVAGLICMLLHKDNKRFGDIAAGTLVIYDEKRRLRKVKKRKANTTAATPPPVVTAADPKPTPVTLRPAPPPWPLSREEQRAIMNFAARQTIMAPQRSQELADILLPEQADNVARLLAYAAWLRGDRDETAAV